MNRRMWLLNGVLAAVLAFAGVQWRSEYLAAKERERRLLTKQVAAAATQPLAPLQNPPAVLATGYNDVAQRLLMHPSRNPNLPPPPPPEAPPPPPPMPPLPKYHGTMNLDGYQVAILSLGAGRFQQVKAGGTIGEFTLADINSRDLTYEWRGQQVRKSLDEALDRTNSDPGPATTTNNTPAANTPPPPPQIKTQIGPTATTDPFGNKACDPNDSYTTGSVVQGWKKVSIPTPFGAACRWEPAGR